MSKILNVRKEIGYCELFASRDTVTEAQEYLNMVAQASDNPPAVHTAAMVLVNTIIEAIERDYDLTLKEETNELWVVLENITEVTEGVVSEFVGVFSDEETALKACHNSRCLLGPAVLGQAIIESADWPGAYYPNEREETNE